VQMPQQSCQTENCVWAPNEWPAENLNKCCHAALAAASPSELQARMTASALANAALASHPAWV